MKIKSIVLKPTILFVTFVLLNAVLSVDVTIVRLSSFLGGIYPLSNYLAIFIIIFTAYLGGTIAILTLIRKQIRELKSRSWTLISFTIIVFAFEIILILILLAMIIQIISNQTYAVRLLEAVAYMTYLLGAFLLGALVYKLSKWFKRNKSLILLFYLIGISLICINAIINVLLLNIQLATKADDVSYRRSLSGGYGPTSSIYKNLQEFIMVLSFLLIWLATIVMLRNHSNKKQSIKYWIIMGIAFIYFFGQYQVAFYNIFLQLTAFNTNITGIVYTSFIGSARPVAGILFGLVFLLTSKLIANRAIKNYMTITGFGMMLIFVTNQPTSLAITPLPPFGIITAASFGLAAYLLYVGLYSSALSVAHDVVIRKQIRSFAKELILLDNIGSPELNQQTESIVMKTVKVLERETKDLELHSGVTSSMEPKDITRYLGMVMQELKERKDGT